MDIHEYILARVCRSKDTSTFSLWDNGVQINAGISIPPIPDIYSLELILILKYSHFNNLGYIYTLTLTEKQWKVVILSGSSEWLTEATWQTCHGDM